MRWIEPAGEQVHEGVAFAAGGTLEPVVSADDLAGGGENNLDEVFKTSDENFRIRAVGIAADECAGFTLDRLAVGQREFIPIGVSRGHVEQAVGAEGDAV